jgi:hypothetical protein
MQPDQQKTVTFVVRLLVVSAAATVVIAIVLGALVSAPLYAIAALAVFDLVLAWAFQTGRLKPMWGSQLGRPEEGGVTGAPADPSADPSHNPYARED